MSLHTRQLIAATPKRVDAWLGRPGAATRLTPGITRMRVERETADRASGEAVLRMPGGLRWIARHDPSDFRAGRQFCDAAANWPFRLTGWRHEHRLDAAELPDGSTGTVVTDTVHTRVPGPLIRPVFGYRHRILAADLAALDRLAIALELPEIPRLRIALTGASGTVGTALAALLGTAGHEIIRLDRPGTETPPHPDQQVRTWDPQEPDPHLLDDVDALVHLAGAPIAGRFTDDHLAAVRDSRVEPTRRLAELVAAADVPVAIGASAVGFYGAQRSEPALDEGAGQGTGVLAEIVAAWEEAWQPARAAGARVVCIRTGLVQSGGGGMLPLLAGVTATGLGGPLGSGAQWFPWISLDDLLDVYHRAVLDERIDGPVNAVAPGSVDNRDYTRTLARVLRRPALVPVPRLGPALLLGQRGADELALADQRVVPAALEALGHEFRHPDLEPALRHELLRDA